MILTRPCRGAVCVHPSGGTRQAGASGLVSTSVASIFTHSMPVPIPKLLTCRVADPLPRNATSTADAGWKRNGNARSARDPGNAMVPPPALLSRTWLSIGRYAVSVTPVKTLSRPASRKVVSPIATFRGDHKIELTLCRRPCRQIEPGMICAGRGFGRQRHRAHRTIETAVSTAAATSSLAG